jgi:hypothetical protein
MIHIFLGDSVSVPVPLTFGGAVFVPGDEWSLIATAKASPAHPDARAVIQKATGAGITAAGSTATLDIVPADTIDLAPGRLFWDIQAQRIAEPHEVRTVAFFDMLLVRDITRETTTSVPVFTTNPPFPGGGGAVTSVNGRTGVVVGLAEQSSLDSAVASLESQLAGLGTFSALDNNGSATISVASLTTAATVYANGATFGYNNSAAASNHRGALGLGEFALLNNDGSAGLDVSSVSAGGSVGCDTVNANTGNIASVSVSTSTAFGNNVAFTYGTNSASNHRTALGLGSFATLNNNGTVSLSVSTAQVVTGLQVGGKRHRHRRHLWRDHHRHSLPNGQQYRHGG